MTWFVVACMLFAVATAQNVRVEFRLLDYSNPSRVLWDGKTTCENTGRSCSPKLTGEVDTTPFALKPWPGKNKVSDWAIIFQKQATDKEQVGKIVSRDICGGGFTQSLLRVEAVHMDVNKITRSKEVEIQQFECPTSRTARDQWSDPKSCTQTYRDAKNAQLTYQWRAYSISAGDCGKAR